MQQPPDLPSERASRWSGRRVWGVFLVNGTEVLGGSLDPHPFGREGPMWITETRPSPEERAQWPEERRAKEEAAWQELVEADIQNGYGGVPGETEDAATYSGGISPARLDVLRELSRRRKNAKRRYERIAYQEHERAKRHNYRQRKADRAAWMASGRTCGLCGEPVEGRGGFDMSELRFSERERLLIGDIPDAATFCHAHCIRDSIRRQLSWRLNAGDMDWRSAGYDADEDWVCELCYQPATGSVRVTRGETAVATVPLCQEHLTAEGAMQATENLIPYFV